MAVIVNESDDWTGLTVLGDGVGRELLGVLERQESLQVRESEVEDVSMVLDALDSSGQALTKRT